jgi:cytosine/adenosine deaminase-related metal-dependent hydrolase
LRLVLRNARTWEGGAVTLRDVAIDGGRVAAVGDPGALSRADREADLEGRVLLPGLVNGHDHLDFSTFPPLGRPPYASFYEWSAEVDRGAGDHAVTEALAVPLHERLLLGGIRNLLAGVTAVAHHNPYHRSLGRADFPVRVLAKYGFAHSPGLTPHLRKTYRTTDRRIPWMVHVAEGTDERCRGEVDRLVEANVLRQNTVIVHGIAIEAGQAARIAASGAALVWCPESNLFLYGATAPVAMLRAAGVRIGLGSDSPVSGVRDPLSNLAAARHKRVFSDDELLALATADTARAVRLPVGGFAEGDPADFVAVASLERFLDGDRSVVDLVLVAGRPLYGAPGPMEVLAPDSGRLVVAGAERRIQSGMGRRVRALLHAHPALSRVSWLADALAAP